MVGVYSSHAYGLEEYNRSGLSAKKFAELAGVKYQTFATWLQN